MYYFIFTINFDAGWSSLVARQAHNLKVRGSNPLPATKPLFLLDYFFGKCLFCVVVDKSCHFMRFFILCFFYLLTNTQ